MIDRRLFLETLAAAGAASALGGCETAPPAAGAGAAPTQAPARVKAEARMPALFLAHGSPLLQDDSSWVGELRGWADALPVPTAVLVLSAHWVERPVRIGAVTHAPLVYDFSGFPRRYYEVTYPAPPAPALAARVRELLGSDTAAGTSGRGLDHGAYVPLMAMYPAAHVPVLQISLPTLAPAALVGLGRALAPLRDEGVLIVGSGFLTHNLSAIDWAARGGTPQWASEFDRWNKERLEAGDVDALLDYRTRAPGVNESLPTHEHYVPLLVALGASLAGGRSERVSFPIEGFAYGAFSKRSVQLG